MRPCLVGLLAVFAVVGGETPVRADFENVEFRSCDSSQIDQLKNALRYTMESSNIFYSELSRGCSQHQQIFFGACSTSRTQTLKDGMLAINQAIWGAPLIMDCSGTFCPSIALAYTQAIPNPPFPIILCPNFWNLPATSDSDQSQAETVSHELSHTFAKTRDIVICSPIDCVRVAIANPDIAINNSYNWGYSLTLNYSGFNIPGGGEGNQSPGQPGTGFICPDGSVDTKCFKKGKGCSVAPGEADYSLLLPLVAIMLLTLKRRRSMKALIGAVGIAILALAGNAYAEPASFASQLPREDRLVCALSTAASEVKTDHAIPLTMTLKNGSGEELFINPQNTPLEGRTLLGDILLVMRDGVEVAYRGVEMHRPLLPADKHRSVKPGEAVSGTILDITTGYPNSRAGQYTVTLRGIAWVRSAGEKQSRLVALSCPPVTVTVTKR